MQVANSSSVWMNTSNSRRQQAFGKAQKVQGAMFKYIFFLILLGFTCSLFYIWSRIQVVNIGYEINRSLSLKEKLIEENKKLTLEAATLKSPVRLESLARNQFHMDLPQKSQIFNQSIVPAPAAPIEVAVKKTTVASPVKNSLQSKSQAKNPSTAQKSKVEQSPKIAKKQENKQSLKIASVASGTPRR